MHSSADLTVVLERDTDEPDNRDAWVVVAAALGDIPRILGAGYLHPPRCACQGPTGALCDVGWLQEFVNCVGAKALVDHGNLEPYPWTKDANRLKITGQMVSDCYNGDCDEWFEPIDCKPVDTSEE